MPGKTRTMGAGLGGSTSRNVNVNANTGGGNKKQGLSTTTNKKVQFVSNAIKNRSYGENRNVVFCMNQLGGVGAVSGGNNSRMFGSTSDGVKDCVTGPYGCEQVVREAYLEAYGREPDKSGLRTYCIAMTKRRWSKADIVADLTKNEDSLAPIYASLAGDYLMVIWDGRGDELEFTERSVNIDTLGNITGSPKIGKITVNSETEYSLTMDEYDVENAMGGPNEKYITPARSYGNMPRINACELYFWSNDIDIGFIKDTDGDGEGDLNDPFPEDESKIAVTKPPVITVTGANPLNVELGSVYEDPGVSATDELDAFIPDTNFNTDNDWGAVDESYIDVNGSVDTNTVGSYTITYTAYDNWGFSSSAERTVNVVDTTAPVITVTGDNPVYIELGNDYEDAGATAEDLSGAVVTSSSNVDVNTLGSYTVTYTATDPYENSSTATRTVNVADTTAPVITLNGNATLTVLLGSDYEELGATAFDLSGDVVVEITGTVDTTTEGEYTLTYTAVDDSNNSASVTRTVIVIDQHPYAFQSLYNALKSEAGVDGRLIQVDTDGEFDDNKMLTMGPGVFAEAKPQMGLFNTSYNMRDWDGIGWYKQVSGFQEGLYARDGQVSVPGIMLLDPDSISSSPTVDQPLAASALDIDEDDKLLGLSIIQLVSGGYAAPPASIFETAALFRFVWRLPEGTPPFYYKLYLRYSPKTKGAGTSSTQEDYQIMDDNAYALSQGYFTSGVGKAEYGAKFPNTSVFDGDQVFHSPPIGPRAGIGPKEGCNCFAMAGSVDSTISGGLFFTDCDKVGWTAGEQYGTTIKVWVEIVDENGDPVDDNSYESLMASAGGEAGGEAGDGGEAGSTSGSISSEASNIITTFGTDGVLTQVQLGNYMTDINGEEPAATVLANVFNNIDANNDNEIDVNEMAAAIAAAAAQKERRELKSI